jgi:hypothetical protein
MGATTIIAAAGLALAAGSAAYQYHQSQNTGINTGKIEYDRQVALDQQAAQAGQYEEYLGIQRQMAEEQARMMEEQMEAQRQALAEAQAKKEEYEAKQQRRLTLGATGRGSTLMTGGTGLGSTAPVGRKTLLGS